MNKFLLFIRLLFTKCLKYRNKLTKNLDNWKMVYQSEIRPANLKPIQLRLIGQSLYLKKLEKVIDDFEITEEERRQLDEIVREFSLNDNYIELAKNSVNQNAVKKLIERQYQDKVFTDEEKRFLLDFANYLNLDSSAVEKMRNNIAISLFKAVMNEKLKDRKLSPYEETELNQAIKNLQIDEVTRKAILPQNSLKELAFAKLLWQLENGVFTVIPSVAITLKRKEECYMSFTGKLLEQKTINKGYSHVGSGVSFRVAKGVRYRVGSGRSVPIKEDILIKHSGNLYLTNQRIVFSASKQSFTIPFNKLLTFDVYRDGIGFVINGGTYIIEFGSQEIELFSTALASSIRNYMDGENEILQDAKKEICDNETFINIKG